MPVDKESYTRIFIMGGRSGEGCDKDDYRAAFGKFGNVADIFMATDRQTRRENGNVYITYEKTSEAALAIEEMNGRALPTHPKPLKVLLAAGKGENAVHGHREADKLLRLFVIVPSQYKDEDVKDHFKEFGDIEYVRVLTEKGTGKSKGLAFVKYFRAYHSALAMELCDPKFKPVFASTRTDREQEMVRRFGPGSGGNNNQQAPTNNFGGPPPNMNFAQGSGNFNAVQSGNGMNPFQVRPQQSMQQHATPSVADMMTQRMGGAVDSGQCRLEVVASTAVSQQQLWQLFDIIPGLEMCDFDSFTGMCYVRYGQSRCAAHAIDKINGFEYPIGFRMTVRYPPVRTELFAKESSYPSTTKLLDEARKQIITSACEGDPEMYNCQTRPDIIATLCLLWSIFKEHLDVKPPQMANALGNVNDLCQNLQALSQAPSVEGLATLVESIQKATAVLQQAGLASVMGGAAPMNTMNTGMPQGMAQSLPSPMPMAPQQQQQQQPMMSQDNTAQYCNVTLPEKQPTMPRDTPIARRVFIVSHPERFPDDVMRDAFCRFGNLIDAYFVPGKNYGFAKYADSDSAQRAMNTLHGQKICGMNIKVLEGEAPKYEDDHTNRKRPHP